LYSNDNLSAAGPLYPPVSFLDYFLPNLGKFINVLAPGGGGGYFPYLPDDRKLINGSF
jgi:hypothetical protein